jgi:hypothetical protein
MSGINAVESPNESSPLLRDEQQNGHIVENAIADDEEADIPLAVEPSTVELFKIMGGVWLGSFFAALGTVEPYGYV